MTNKDSHFIAIGTGHNKGHIWANRFLLWCLPLLLVFLQVRLIQKFPLPLEYPHLNYTLLLLSALFSALAVNRFFSPFQKLSAAVLLFYSDRVVFKNLQTRISIPRNQNTLVSLELLGGPLQLMRLQVGDYKKILPMPNVSPKFIHRAKEDGIQIYHSRRKGWGSALVGIAAIILIPNLFQRLHLPKPTLQFVLGFIALAVIFVVKKMERFQKNTSPLRVLKKLLLTRYALQSLVSFLIALSLPYLAMQPFSEVDRKISRANILMKEGRFTEANHQFKEIEDPNRSEYFKNNYAWFLTVVPNQELRNPKKAIQLAEEALLQRNVKHTQDTLACAYMANGQPEKALEIAKENNLKDRVSLFEQHALCKDSKLASRSVASGK